MTDEELTSEQLKEFVLTCLERDWIKPVFSEQGAIVMVPVPGDNPVWELHMAEMDEAVASLCEMGYVEVNSITEDGEFLFELTELGKEAINAEQA